MKARYSLATNPVNFNFLDWLVAATTLGATHVCIDDSNIKGKFSPQDTRERIENILIPACELARVIVSFSNDGEDICGYHMDSVINAYRKTGEIKKLRASGAYYSAHQYTVTLRSYSRFPQRNSNEQAWRQFAAEIGAHVIEDWYVKPISLHDRMALYADAEMNWFVANGPDTLCYLSEAPCTIFMKNVDAAYHEKHGFPVGSQLPWLNERQRFIWSDDNYENIKASRPA